MYNTDTPKGFWASKLPVSESCACWVASQPPEVRFQVRRGAHNPACPIYRPSLDPVDAAHDNRLRQRMEAKS